MQLSHGVHTEHAIQFNNPNRLMTFNEVIMWWQWACDQLKTCNTDSERDKVIERLTIGSTSKLYYHSNGKLTYANTSTRAPFFGDLSEEQQELLKQLHGGAILNAIDSKENDEARQLAPHKVGPIMVAFEKLKIGDKVYDTVLEEFGTVTDVTYNSVEATFDEGESETFSYSNNGQFVIGETVPIILKVVEDVAQ